MDVPRRSRLDQMFPAELAIREAVIAVERLGADVTLTEAVILLQQARDKVADYIDAHRVELAPRCFYFGCSGHYLFEPGRSKHDDKIEYYGDHVSLDATLAPRRITSGLSKVGRRGSLCWAGLGATRQERQHITYNSEECPQGQFLLHHLDNGFTAIQWWDRCQGDTRGACNSTVLLEGVRTSEEMLVALATHFPHVLENLARGGPPPRRDRPSDPQPPVQLIEVKVDD